MFPLRAHEARTYTPYPLFCPHLILFIINTQTTIKTTKTKLIPTFIAI